MAEHSRAVNSPISTEASLQLLLAKQLRVQKVVNVVHCGPP